MSDFNVPLQAETRIMQRTEMKTFT